MDEAELGSLLRQLCEQQARWSQATFGSDEERGPLGALRHLEREAREAQAAPHDITEYADCLLLIIDAARRSGWSYQQLINAAKEKLQVCEQREWPSPEPDQPVEHIRGHGPAPK